MNDARRSANPEAGRAACGLRAIWRGFASPDAMDRFAFEETAMRAATKGILISALVLGMGGTVFAQSAGGGGGGGNGGAGAAGGGQGGTGMSKPNASGSTDTVSGASGTNSMGGADTTSQKKKHKKASTNMPASSG